jgi:hypothetical protein
MTNGFFVVDGGISSVTWLVEAEFSHIVRQQRVEQNELIINCK